MRSRQGIGYYMNTENKVHKLYGFIVCNTFPLLVSVNSYKMYQQQV